MPKSASTADVVTVERLLSTLERHLRSSSVLDADADAQREAVWLLADVLGRPRSWPRSAKNDVLVEEDINRVLQGLTRRCAGAPLAYATGRAGFRTLELLVDERVLIPRPETEQLVELALARLGPDSTVCDVGTGSGAIALSLAVEGPARRVIGTDLSTDALDVARTNAAALDESTRRRLEWRAGSLLAPLHDLAGQVDVLVSNPPYIANSEVARLPASVRDWEPPLALVSGLDGLDAARSLIAEATGVLRPGGWLLLELGADNVTAAERLACEAQVYDSVQVVRDLFGRDRFLIARFRAAPTRLSSHA
jgi:release factor glutamine methyltransferase